MDPVLPPSVNNYNKPRIAVFTTLLLCGYIITFYFGAPSKFILILPLLFLELSAAYYMTILHPDHFWKIYPFPNLLITAMTYLCNEESTLLAIFVFVTLMLAFLKTIFLKYNSADVPMKNSMVYFVFSLLVPLNTALDKKFKNPLPVSRQHLVLRLRRFFAKVIFGLATVGLAHLNVHVIVSYYCALWYSYFAYSGFCDIFSFVIEFSTDVPVHPVFNAPFFATSPRDFWSRRWNLIVRNFYHEFLFIPLSHSKWLSRRSSKAISAGLVFIFSGLTHEIFVWEVTGTWDWFGYMTAFFTIHGILTLLESYLFPTSEKKIPWLISVLSFHVIMLITAPLFFRPLLKIFNASGFHFE